MTLSVAGKRCLRGPQLNSEVRYWYCETAASGAANAGWDYCCRPGNSCGYSEGYNYPW